ncbi:CD48 antigen-like [Danio aesculapii]|uniref:CD48 antigen-like n=1 Tax=Danio aesculapii TaxID=1142201 RepID=UPI0024C0A10A|nr:CD48 antigen-like [Danio aesculapii]
MIDALDLFCLNFFLLCGVASVETEIRLSVMEGDSLTLRTGLTELQRDDEVEWRFGTSRISTITAGNITNDDETFKDRLQLEEQTGDITVTNVSHEHSGVYQLSIIIRNKKSNKRFTVTVFAHLPIPVIFSDSSKCSSSPERSSRILLCSVLNVSAVSLSWYKGNGVLSSISVSDFSVSLSLPLEVENQNKNTYSCVVNNPIRNQTTHLDISQLCHACSDCNLCFDSAEAVVRLIITAVVGVAAVTAVVLLANDIRTVVKEQTIKP